MVFRGGNFDGAPAHIGVAPADGIGDVVDCFALAGGNLVGPLARLIGRRLLVRLGQFHNRIAVTVAQDAPAVGVRFFVCFEALLRIGNLGVELLLLLVELVF